MSRLGRRRSPRHIFSRRTSRSIRSLTHPRVPPHRRRTSATLLYHILSQEPAWSSYSSPSPRCGNCSRFSSLRLPVEGLHGNMQQRARLKYLDEFKKGAGGGGKTSSSSPPTSRRGSTSRASTSWFTTRCPSADASCTVGSNRSSQRRGRVGDARHPRGASAVPNVAQEPQPRNAAAVVSNGGERGGRGEVARLRRA